MDMTTLIAAAATAAGGAPEDSTGYAHWKGRVLSIASDLATMVGSHENREKRKVGIGFGENDKVTAFNARLVSVKKITKGTGENTIQKGQLVLEAFNSSNADSNGHETIETAPLGTPEGDEEFVRAQALVGQNVKIYKRNFLHPTDKSKKLKELVAVDPSSGFSAAPAAPTPTPAPPAADASENTERVSEIREQLNALTGDEKNRFREFMQLKNRSVRAVDWSDDDLDTIEGWLFADPEGQPE